MLDTYVIVGNEGVAYVGLHESERDCWRVYFGFPDDSEIEQLKADGFYCARATITWTDPRPRKVA